jgi:hypothetical protein
MNEKNYYKVTIKSEFEDSKGRMKTRKDNYIVSAVNPTDVEVKMTKQLSMSDYEITSINLLNIIEVIE